MRCVGKMQRKWREMRCRVGSLVIGMMEEGWSVEFHSCVDTCMMRGVTTIWL